eukprot:5503018-Ditylum_brightwellii.AAC.1
MLRAPVLVHYYNSNGEDDITADYNSDSDDNLYEFSEEEDEEDLGEYSEKDDKEPIHLPHAWWEAGQNKKFPTCQLDSGEANSDTHPARYAPATYPLLSLFSTPTATAQ